MKVSISTVLYLLLLIQPVAADEIDLAVADLKSKLNASIAVLQDTNRDFEVKKNAIEEILMPIFDFSIMAKLSLGKKNWKKLTDGNKDKFANLFTTLMKRTYLDKLTRYTDEKLVYESPIWVKKKIHIQTYLISQGEKTSIQYKLYKRGNEWKIYDIEIENVSIIRSYRSQFDHILKTGTVDDLFVELEKTVNS